MKPSTHERLARLATAAQKARCPGFTLVELLVVFGSLAVLGVVLAPAMARVKPSGFSVQCLNNTRQLARAWQLYAEDNNGVLVVNLHGGANLGGAGDPIYGHSWVSGWLDWSTSLDNKNTALLSNPQYARLAPYLNRDTNVFKCPADKFLSAVQRSSGWSRRVRSYSADIALGKGNAETGPWDPIYRHVIKLSDFQFPTPGETWLFVDEHPDSINDGAFFGPHLSQWVDLPATYHNGAAGFAFADGHSEMHKWTGSLTRLPVIAFTFPLITPPVGDPDLHWVSFHSPRLTPTSY